MNLKGKLHELATTLLERSRKNEVKWERVVRDGASDDAFYNRVKFPTSEFQIWFIPNPTGPDIICASLDKRGGLEIARIEAETDESPQWRLLSDLYEESNRSITGWDKVLSEIEEELKKDVIGQRADPVPAGQMPVITRPPSGLPRTGPPRT